MPRLSGMLSAPSCDRAVADVGTVAFIGASLPLQTRDMAPRRARRQTISPAGPLSQAQRMPHRTLPPQHAVRAFVAVARCLIRERAAASLEVRRARQRAGKGV